MADMIIEGVTNIAWDANGRMIVTHSDPPKPPATTDLVASLVDLRAALNDGAKDITIAGTILVNSPVVVPRIAERVIRGTSNATIKSTGRDFRIMALGNGQGGRLTINDLTIDGGWRTNPGECTSDIAANFWLPSLDYLEMNGCSTMFSRRTGIFATNTGRLILRNCTGYALPRDFIWSNGSWDVLVEGCRVTYCGDDGISCHVQPGTTGDNRTVVIRNNELRDTLGIKVLGGGKSVLIEGNRIIAPAFYGIRLGVDPTTGEGAGTQSNITVRSNHIENVRATSPCHPGQTQGVWLFMYAPDQDMANVVIDGNTLVRNEWKAAAPASLQDVYPLWGALGAYSKTAFLPDAVLDLGSEATRYVCKNPGDIIGSNLMNGFSK